MLYQTTTDVSDASCFLRQQSDGDGDLDWELAISLEGLNTLLLALELMLGNARGRHLRPPAKQQQSQAEGVWMGNIIVDKRCVSEDQPSSSCLSLPSSLS